jgi:O-antigen ligase
MKISYNFRDSGVHRLTVWLFVDGDKNSFKESKLLKLGSRISHGGLSLVLLGLSMVCFWYEALFTKIGFGWVENWKLGTIFLLLSLLFCDKSKLRSTRPVIYLLLFVVSLLVSGLWAAFNGLELGMLFTGMLLFCQFAVAFIVGSTYEAKKVLINMILIISLPTLLIGLSQGFFGEATSKLWVSSAETLINNRAFGFFGSPNILGSLSMITAIMAIASFMNKKKWYYLVYTAMSVTVMILTFSRSAWLGLAVGIVVALVIKNWRLLFLAPLGLITLIIPSVRQRLLVAFSQEYLVDAAIDGRTWSFNNAIEIFSHSPIIGTGPGSYGGQTAIYYDSPVYLTGLQNGYVALPYTDNQWVQILVQVGLVGALTVAGFFISLFVNNLRHYIKANSYFSLGIIAATVAIFINGIFANIWEFGAISTLAGAYLGLGNGYEK